MFQKVVLEDGAKMMFDISGLKRKEDEVDPETEGASLCNSFLAGHSRWGNLTFERG